MTWKDELLMLWILFAVVIAFAARHFLGEAAQLVQQVGSCSIAYLPGLVHFVAGLLR
jgi:hypothetical protein